MDLPSEVICEQCGQLARVVTRPEDYEALASKSLLTAEQMNRGLIITIECPRCSQQQQPFRPVEPSN